MTERELDDGLRRAAAQQRAVAERALADLDLTPAQFAVLWIVMEQPGISAADVARLERLTPPTVSVIVGNLIRKNALEKRPHPDNARIQQLSVTERGARLVQEGATRLEGSLCRIRSALPAGAEPLVKQWLRDIAESGA
jgi:DNA-binding MarR family transcriptional regulator